MKQPTEKLYMNQMTRHLMYKLFGIQKVAKIKELEHWLNLMPDLNEQEKSIATFYQNRLLENIDDWSEQELSLGFIGPIINIINFKVPYQLNFFAQRSLTATIGKYELTGKPDGMLAKGSSEPEQPYFNFQEHKRDINSSGDPIGQNLAAMLAGQALNKEEQPIYGCYVVGRNWYFMVLKGKNYAVSKDLSATDQADLFKIIKLLKALRIILFKQLGINQ